MFKYIAFALLWVVLFVDTNVGEPRLDYGVRNVTLENWNPPEEIARKFPYYVSGFDHDNRPIYILELGKWDIRAAVVEGGIKLHNLNLHLDKFYYRMGQAGRNFRFGYEQGADTVAVIVDWDDFSMSQLASGPTVQFFLKHFAGFQRMQECLAYGFFVNANTVANTLINMARPVIGSVMERIEVYGTQKSRWVPKILRNIHPSQLPAKYGGVPNFKPVAFYG